MTQNYCLSLIAFILCQFLASFGVPIEDSNLVVDEEALYSPDLVEKVTQVLDIVRGRKPYYNDNYYHEKDKDSDKYYYWIWAIIDKYGQQTQGVPSVPLAPGPVTIPTPIPPLPDISVPITSGLPNISLPALSLPDISSLLNITTLVTGAFGAITGLLGNISLPINATDLIPANLTLPEIMANVSLSESVNVAENVTGGLSVGIGARVGDEEVVSLKGNISESFVSAVRSQYALRYLHECLQKHASNLRLDNVDSLEITTEYVALSALITVLEQNAKALIPEEIFAQLYQAKDDLASTVPTRSELDLSTSLGCFVQSYYVFSGQRLLV